MPYVYCSLFIIFKRWKQPKCPLIDEWITKMKYIWDIIQYYITIKKMPVLPFAVA